ncbi:uncharacterized protein LOC125315661 [Rhodamnia argentea]|uniref:Uncharacterized protein LOC125315661 n=1 Tax=Rhodamnia argentea TaxID=178133 RepID=A0ABM3HL60_9MYRT|nr:uncharacterized protein LOC125315661 [Rhodamnia argentea]
MEGVNDQIASVEGTLSGDQDFDEDDYFLPTAWLYLTELHRSMHTRELVRDKILSGPNWMREVLHGHSDRAFKAFSMERHVFLNLCGLPKAKGWLQDSRYLKIDEHVRIFLCTISHKNSNRDLCERFQHSGQIIGKYFNLALKAVRKLAKEVIVPPPFDVVPQEILLNPKHEPYFKGYVGAIDGTHIHAAVPVAQQIRFKGRKGITTQNVLCVCSFDMRFTFVYASWEGSANDYRVPSVALETPELQFPRPPLGKYYVVDSGYASTPGFLTPFKGEQYHINDFKSNARPTRARELFNYKHSSLRNIIERSFAASKNRFFVLRHMSPFSIRKQAHIVVTCCAIHNYIRDQDKRDRNFFEYGNPEYVCEPAHDEVTCVLSTEEGTEMNILRKHIANKIASDHYMDEIP